MADPANPEGCTSRLGRARRMSSAGVARRAAVVRQTRAKLLFLLAKSEAVFCRANAAPGRMVVFRGFRRRIEEQRLRRGCNG